MLRCEKYKKFLEDLTPHEWYVAQAQLAAQRKVQRREDWINGEYEYLFVSNSIFYSNFYVRIMVKVDFD